MAGMSRNNSTVSFQGFSVFQPALGSSLQWLPVLGSYELDDMVHNFLPGPASIQDKRAHISMDFFAYARQTGETFKFYPVYNASFASSATDSPASSSALHDSGYGSSFNVSPVVSDMSPFTPSMSASTPASTTSDSRTKSRSGPSQKKTASAVSRAPLDFSNHPGMRILTKDGRDITHSASRGCKSKEQRDHAHLMRIIKACEACRKKKIRCDPSHKKRTSMQAQPARADSKQAKKTKMTTRHEESPTQDFSFETPSSQDFVPSFGTGLADTGSFEGLNQNPDDFWQQFVHFDDQAVSFSQDYAFPLDATGYLTSSNGSSFAPPPQPLLPATPSLLQHSYGVLPDFASQEPAPPYLNPGDSCGTNYQDFNLYSPVSEQLDEEPQFVRKPRRKTHTSKQDNLVDSGLQQSTHQPPGIDGDEYLYSQNHQHGDPFETSFSAWSHVNVDGYPDGSLPQNTVPSGDRTHGMTPSATGIDKNPPGAPAGQPRPRSLLPLATVRAAAVSRASPGGRDPVQSFETNMRTLANAWPTSYTTPPATWVQQFSVAAVVTAQPRAGTSVGAPGHLLTVSHTGRVRVEAPSTGLAQADVSQLAQAVPEQRIAPDSVSSGRSRRRAGSPSSLRRALFARSAFVLEPSDYIDDVMQDRATAPLSSVPPRSEPGLSHGAEASTVGAGLRTAPHAHYAPSGTGSTALATGCTSAALAGSILPTPSPTLQGVPNTRLEGVQPSMSRNASTSVDHLVSLGLVSCLLVLLLRWASRRWQLELLFALCISLSSFVGRPLLGGGVERFKCAAAKPAGSLWRSLQEATASCT